MHERVNCWLVSFKDGKHVRIDVTTGTTQMLRIADLQLAEQITGHQAERFSGAIDFLLLMREQLNYTRCPHLCLELLEKANLYFSFDYDAFVYADNQGDGSLDKDLSPDSDCQLIAVLRQRTFFVVGVTTYNIDKCDHHVRVRHQVKGTA